ncbi:MAG: type II toxin-antitoxin system VapC family toxin [Acidobacteriota bacterium]|nr:type II toxin-antitoxin system VapC family toxin [Acidobacteriota bacterium]
MPILFDSSVYIAALRPGGNPELVAQRWAMESPLWLSSVVLEELYVGARPGDRRALEKLERDFEKAGRLLVPNLGDWTAAGKMLAAIAEKHGYETIGRARLTNDTLIATSAARMGIRVVTVNARDYALLAGFCALQWEARGL